MLQVIFACSVLPVSAPEGQQAGHDGAAGILSVHAPVDWLTGLIT